MTQLAVLEDTFQGSATARKKAWLVRAVGHCPQSPRASLCALLHSLYVCPLISRPFNLPISDNFTDIVCVAGCNNRLLNK